MSAHEALLLKPYLRLDEAAELLGVSPRTVARYLAAEKLACRLTLGGKRRIVTESVKPYL